MVLEISDLCARPAGAECSKGEILRGVNLRIRAGEVHALMGMNGCGKSTLAKVLVGDAAYEVTRGEVRLCGLNLLSMQPHERSLAGLFLAFQTPPALDGVATLDFLFATHNAHRRARGLVPLDVVEFQALLCEKLEQLGMPPAAASRGVNEGLSGGERKKCEMLQMLLLSPRLAVLDEIDSGLDVDALREVGSALSHDLADADPKRALLVVTHLERFLQQVPADFVHVMHNGRIVATGGQELARRLDADGYDWIVGMGTPPG